MAGGSMGLPSKWRPPDLMGHYFRWLTTNAVNASARMTSRMTQSSPSRAADLSAMRSRAAGKGLVWQTVIADTCETDR